MLRVVQLRHPDHGRRVAIVDEPRLRLVRDHQSAYDAATEAIAAGTKLATLLSANATDETLEYDEIYQGRSPWTLLSCFDHPVEPARCVVTGTGLTHKASATMRQNMHGKPADLTDSMRMYALGLEGGRPAAGRAGASPEWFYKGNGHRLRAHNESLDVPAHADDGGEEAEIAGCYIIGREGTPYRVGLAQGNEFSDHVHESKNYLYLAESKLRTCSIGPELVINADFTEVRGTSRILRSGETVWEGQLASGEKWMCHTLANIEHHHFKHADHRTPGDAHVHFLGADEFSFKDKLELRDGDVMQIAFEPFGRPLRNPIRVERSPQRFVAVTEL